MPSPKTQVKNSIESANLVREYMDYMQKLDKIKDQICKCKVELEREKFKSKGSL